MATRMNAGVMTVYSIDAFSGTPGKNLDTPRLSLSLTIAGGTVRTGDLTYFTGSDAVLYGAGEEIGTLSFDRVTFEGATLAFGFEARALELDPTDFEPVDNGSRVTLGGDVRVTFQD